MQVALAAMAGAWLVFEWVRVLVREQVEGDFLNHWEFGRRFAAGLPLYKDGLDVVYLPLWAMGHALLAFMPPRTAAFVVFPIAPMALMVILVPGHDVEHHAPVHLLHSLVPQVQTLNNGKRLLVTELPGGVEVEMRHRAKGLHMDFPVLGIAVEAPCHEVRAAILLKYPAL